MCQMCCVLTADKSNPFLPIEVELKLIGAAESADWRIDPRIASLSSVDTIGASTSSHSTISVGGTRTGYVNTSGDKDWFRVTLTAGTTYQINLNGGTLSDPYLVLRNPAGTQVAYNDDISTNNRDSRLLYTPTSSGSYFIEAGGYLTRTGSYTLSIVETTVINGAGGPAGVTSTGGDAYMQTINWGTRLNNTQVIDVYFAASGVNVNDGEEIVTSNGWSSYEMTQIMNVLQRFSDVANITFRQTTSAAAADLILVTADLGGDLLGYFNTPVTSSGVGGQGVGVFGYTSTGWDTAGLARGGYGYLTALHEIGHGLGLAHPHDDGGVSTVMPGVSSNSDRGTGNANQGINTVMTYNDGWQTAPHGAASTSWGYGFNGGLMMLDIAVLQHHYGANTTFNSTGTTYTLPGSNGPGTYYQCIWDTGGTDTIRYSGSTACTIDLRTVSGTITADEFNRVSYVNGIHGGFTLARGVIIENGTGGSGADTIHGNDATNLLKGNDGNDALYGYAGNDQLYGSSGDDIVDGGFGNDTLSAGIGIDTLVFSGSTNITVDLSVTTGQATGQGTDIITGFENVATGGGADTIRGSAMTNFLRGGSGNDQIFGGGANDRLAGDAGDDILRGELGNDRLTGGAGADVFVFHSSDAGADIITDFIVGLDRIDISTIAAATNMAWVNANTVDVSGNAVITLGSGYRITLIGVTESQLMASDFLF